jgi:hypothetical protein
MATDVHMMTCREARVVGEPVSHVTTMRYFNHLPSGTICALISQAAENGWILTHQPLSDL